MCEPPARSGELIASGRMVVGARRRFPVVLLRAAAWAVVATGAACSLVVNQSDSQCRATSDCLARGPAFANTYCDDSQACVASCTTNAQCTGTNTSDPWICRADHVCAPLKSQDCATLLADPNDTDAPVLSANGEATSGEESQVLWLGMLLPLDPTTAPLSQAKEDAANLARNDFNTAGSLPPVVAGGPSRKLAFVVCDDTVDADRAAAHLVNDVHVPGIIGPVYSDTLVTVATDVTDPAGVLLITPSATATDISELPGKDDLIWRTCPSDALQAQAMALVIEQTIAPEIAETPIKIANVHKGDSYGEGLGSALESALVFNGATAAVNATNGDYIAFDYGDPSAASDTDPTKEYAAAVTEVLSFLPHVIALVGTQEMITYIMQPIEAGWPSSAAYRPRYLLSDGAYPRPELLQLVGTNADLRHRVLGTAPGTTSPAYTSFLSYYDSLVQDGTTPVLSTAATYDAAYLFAYATAAIGATPVTGANLVEGLKKIVVQGAPQVPIGPAGITRALSLLTTPGEEEMKVVGTSGPLDYDTATGDPDGDIQVWCLSIDASGDATGFINSGEYYDAEKQTLIPPVTCP